MDILVKLFSYENKAVDKSIIPKTSIEKYIKTKGWLTRAKNRTALGGITHLDRNTEDSMDGIIGKDDRLLVNDNSTHYISSIEVREDGFCYAVFSIFHSEGFDEETAKKIRKIKALVRQGVMLPVSVVIDAYWDHSEIAQEIIDIRGADFTLNAGFKGSEIVKIIKDDDDK